MAGTADVVRVTVSGGDIWVSVGPTPVAAPGSGYLQTDGSTADYGTLTAADKVAVIDA